MLKTTQYHGFIMERDYNENDDNRTYARQFVAHTKAPYTANYIEYLLDQLHLEFGSQEEGYIFGYTNGHEELKMIIADNEVTIALIVTDEHKEVTR